jgi:RHS repeat-associated protein
MARTGNHPQPFTYVGRWGVRAESAAGLYQMRSRYYDPGSGRFLSRDPFWPRPSEALSLNPYGYAANNPLLFVDPTGAWDEYSGEGYVPLEVRLILLLYLQRLYGPAFSQLGPSQMIAYLGMNPLAMMRLGMLQQFMLTYVVLSQTQLGPLFAGRAWQVPGGPFLPALTMMARSNPFLLQAMLSGSGFHPAALMFYGQYQRGLLMAYQAMASLAVAQVFMPGLVPEMATVNAHAINLNLYGPDLGESDYDLADENDVNPEDVRPQGMAFVNGERVYEKPWDFLEAAEWYDELYDYLDDCDYWPGDLVRELVGEALFGPGMGWRLQFRYQRAEYY